MILNTDFIAIVIVTVVALFVAWDARRLKSPIYPLVRALLVVITVIWAMALGLYFGL
jgi:hypothetical protein